jgi:hypothetical protein
MRIIIGFIVTPIVFSVAFAIGEYLFVMVYSEHELTLIEWLLGGILLAAPFSYIVMLVVGVPAFFIFRKFGWLRLWIVALTGAITSAMIGVFLFRTTLLSLHSVICGLLAGVIFWIIALWKPNNRLLPDAQKGARH